MYLKLPYFMDLKARFDEKFKSLTKHFQSHPRKAKKLRSFADDFFSETAFLRDNIYFLVTFHLISTLFSVLLIKFPYVCPISKNF